MRRRRTVEAWPALGGLLQVDASAARSIGDVVGCPPAATVHVP